MGTEIDSTFLESHLANESRALKTLIFFDPVSPFLGIQPKEINFLNANKDIHLSVIFNSERLGII